MQRTERGKTKRRRIKAVHSKEFEEIARDDVHTLRGEGRRIAKVRRSYVQSSNQSSLLNMLIRSSHPFRCFCSLCGKRNHSRPCSKCRTGIVVRGVRTKRQTCVARESDMTAPCAAQRGDNDDDTEGKIMRLMC
jgi:hypothetical protein